MAIFNSYVKLPEAKQGSYLYGPKGTTSASTHVF